MFHVFLDLPLWHESGQWHSITECLATLCGSAQHIRTCWACTITSHFFLHSWRSGVRTTLTTPQVFQRLAKQLKLLNVIELQYVSPKLMDVRDMDIAVPGTYQSGKPVVAIAQVLPTFQVINSKHRPRKFSMRGQDGKEYTYCLKGELSRLESFAQLMAHPGHEDLRQDERVMQLFGLVNTLLGADQEAAKRHLAIQLFSVTPLSPGAGVSGWLQHSDTLHMLIKGYRESRKILVDIENRLMQQVSWEILDEIQS